MSNEKNFQIRDDLCYITPVTLTDPRLCVRQEVIHYDRNIRYCICYRTDPDALQRLLPPGFTPIEDEPIIQVNFTTSYGIDYMAGRDYSLVGVDALCRFDGEVDHLEGWFGLVLWMNKFLPMVVGREVLGAAKIMADVELREFENKKHFNMSEEGALLIEGSIWDMKEWTQEEIRKDVAQAKDRQWLGWKYIPNVTGTGADVSNAAYLPTARNVKRRWSCKGEVKYYDMPWEAAPLSAPIVSKIKALPILEYTDSYVQEDTCDYLFREERVLR